MKKYLAILIVVLMGITYGCNNPVKEENSEISNTKSIPSSKEPLPSRSERKGIQTYRPTATIQQPEVA